MTQMNKAIELLKEILKDIDDNTIQHDWPPTWTWPDRVRAVIVEWDEAVEAAGEENNVELLKNLRDIFKQNELLMQVRDYWEVMDDIDKAIADVDVLEKQIKEAISCLLLEPQDFDGAMKLLYTSIGVKWEPIKEGKSISFDKLIVDPEQEFLEKEDE